jgi:hypothetical protein
VLSALVIYAVLRRFLDKPEEASPVVEMASEAARIPEAKPEQVAV